MAETLIEWTDRVWNFLRGCTIISAGCKHCYAMLLAHRFNYPGGAYEGLTEMGPNGPRWNGHIRVVEEKISEPLHVKRGQKWFVNSMSDLFHEDVPFEVIDKAFAVMALTPRHTYQVLTKRPERMRQYILGDTGVTIEAFGPGELTRKGVVFCETASFANVKQCPGVIKWPLPNVILGVSVENQEAANKRIPKAIIPLLMAGWKCMLSCEPLLGPIGFKLVPGFNRIDLEQRLQNLWVIVGGESGPKARQCEVDWIRSIVEQCENARVKCFVKQLGRNVIDRNDAGFDGNDGIEWPSILMEEGRVKDLDIGYQGAPVQILLKDAKGGDPEEWPENLRVRESLEVRTC